MNFPLHCDQVWSFVKPAANVTCLEFLQFFQVSFIAASTNLRLRLNFYSISENKYNKFDSFSKKTKNGRSWRENEKVETIPKTGGFWLKWEGWNLCLRAAYYNKQFNYFKLAFKNTIHCNPYKDRPTFKLKSCITWKLVKQNIFA